MCFLTSGCFSGRRRPRRCRPGRRCRRRIHGAPSPAARCHRGACGWRFPLLLCLESLSTDVVVLLPVFVLTKGPTIPCGVAATAGFTGLAPAVPAALTRVFLLVNNSKCILRCLPLGFCHRPLHLGSLCGDHFMGFPFSFRHCFLKLCHCLAFHLVHSFLSFLPDLLWHISRSGPVKEIPM